MTEQPVRKVNKNVSNRKFLCLKFSNAVRLRNHSKVPSIDWQSFFLHKFACVFIQNFFYLKIFVRNINALDWILFETFFFLPNRKDISMTRSPMTLLRWSWFRSDQCNNVALTRTEYITLPLTICRDSWLRTLQEYWENTDTFSNTESVSRLKSSILRSFYAMNFAVDSNASNLIRPS